MCTKHSQHHLVRKNNKHGFIYIGLVYKVVTFQHCNEGIEKETFFKSRKQVVLYLQHKQMNSYDIPLY